MSQKANKTMPPLIVNPELLDFYYYCSPLRDKSQVQMGFNMAVANHNCFALMVNGVYKTVVAPHAFLPVRCNDDIPEQRAEALEFGKKLLSRANGLFVYGPYISAGMIEEIEYAISLGKEVVFGQEQLYADFCKKHAKYANSVSLSKHPKLDDLCDHASIPRLFLTNVFVCFALITANRCLVDADQIISSKKLVRIREALLRHRKEVRG